MTGAVGAVGQQEHRGMELAVEEINAAGGVKGRKLKLETVDDQGSVNLTTAGFKKLATDTKVPVVIGPGITANAMASAPLAEQYGVTQVLLVAQPHIANGKKNVFGVPLPGKANSEAMVNYAKAQGYKSAAIIWGNTPYGQEGNKDIPPPPRRPGSTSSAPRASTAASSTSPRRRARPPPATPTRSSCTAAAATATPCC